jgi:hypothetical protein
VDIRVHNMPAVILPLTVGPIIRTAGVKTINASFFFPFSSLALLLCTLVNKRYIRC